MKIKQTEKATATRKAVPGEAGLYVQVGKRHGTYSAMIQNKYTPLGHDLTEAKAKLANLLELPMPSGTLTIEAMCKDYIREQRQLIKIGAKIALKPGTIDDYEKSFEKQIIPKFGKMRPQDFEPTDKAEFLARAYHTDPPRSIKANRDMAALGSAFNHGMRHGFAKSNPCHGVKRNIELPRTRSVTKDELRAFLTHARHKGGSAYLVALIGCTIALTGRRRAEIQRVHRNQLEDNGFNVTIESTQKGFATDDSKNDSRCYFVKMSPSLRTLVDEVKTIKRKIPSLFLFGTLNGEAYTEGGFKTLWNRLMHSYAPGGPKSPEWFTAHDLRAMYVSIMLGEGRNPNTHQNEATMKARYDRRGRIQTECWE